MLAGNGHVFDIGTEVLVRVGDHMNGAGQLADRKLSITSFPQKCHPTNTQEIFVYSYAGGDIHSIEVGTFTNEGANVTLNVAVAGCPYPIATLSVTLALG